jgi:hypothetical protein
MKFLEFFVDDSPRGASSFGAAWSAYLCIYRSLLCVTLVFWTNLDYSNFVF